MRSLPAEDIHIRQGENGRELRFAAALANFGQGPLVLRPDNERPCPEGQRFASQVIFIDGDNDGAFDAEADTRTETIPAGCMVYHPTHEHWHFDSSAGYALTAPGTDSPLTSHDKVSFCMRDSRRLPNATLVSPQTYGDCERDRIQGISAGWADVYSSDLDGQALDLSGISDGSYCLRLTSDPFDLLQETDDSDNSSAVAIEISGTDVTRAQDDAACTVR